MNDDLLTGRTRLDRHPERGSHDRETIHRILDEALVCHVGFTVDGQPYVIPASYGRVGEALYLHGAAASRMVCALERGVPACLTVTLLDGIVLARSAVRHSVNYRSVVVLGQATPVVDPAEKLMALRAITEHVIQGRWDDVRAPSKGELAATKVVRLAITEASAKIRAGPPDDDVRDLGRPVWAGVVPLELLPGAPVPDASTDPESSVPEYAKAYSRRR